MTRSLLFALTLAAGLVDVGGALRAHAQPAPRSPEQESADRHFKNGVAQFKAGKFAEALAEFERANEISPHPLVLYNIAGCYRELARYPEAVKFYNRFLKEGVGRVPESRISDAKAELAGIYGLVARVTVKLEPEDGASLSVDEQPVSALPSDMPLILPPGEHKLLARAAGRAEAKHALTLAPGDVTTIVLSLPALSEGQTSPGAISARPGPDASVHAPGSTRVEPAARRFAVSFSFGTNALRVAETGAPAVGLGLALGSRLELGVDATIVAYAIVPSLRVRLAGDAVALHAIAAAPIALTDGDTMETFVAGAAGLGLRMRLPALPGLALRLESYASFAGKTHGTTIPTFLGGELWF